VTRSCSPAHRPREQAYHHPAPGCTHTRPRGQEHPWRVRPVPYRWEVLISFYPASSREPLCAPESAETGADGGWYPVPVLDRYRAHHSMTNIAPIVISDA
jgi:hypothetical protein